MYKLPFPWEGLYIIDNVIARGLTDTVTSTGNIGHVPPSIFSNKQYLYTYVMNKNKLYPNWTTHFCLTNKSSSNAHHLVLASVESSTPHGPKQAEANSLSTQPAPLPYAFTCSSMEQLAACCCFGFLSR